MLADPDSAALFARAPLTAVRADPASAALFAPALPAVVRAADVPAAVPPHFAAAALGVAAAAAAIVVTGTSPSAAPAVEATTGVLRQPVDQILLLPGLRQFESRAEFLQLRDGLRARGQTTSDEARVGHGYNQCGTHGQPGRRRKCGE
jgi:hypothetical protein